MNAVSQPATAAARWRQVTRASYDVDGRGRARFDDDPSLRYVAPLTYYLARAQEGIGSPDAQASYEAFLAMQPESEKDPLVDDARKRVH